MSRKYTGAIGGAIRGKPSTASATLLRAAALHCNQTFHAFDPIRIPMDAVQLGSN